MDSSRTGRHAQGASTPQPTPIVNDGTSIHDLVIADMKDRKQFGLDKYGTVLQAHNGRSLDLDLYQKLMDALCYTKQKMVEDEWQPGIPQSEHKRVLFRTEEHVCMLVYDDGARTWYVPGPGDQDFALASYAAADLADMADDFGCSFKVLP